MLRRWRTRFRQNGQDFGRQGMKDEHYIITVTPCSTMALRPSNSLIRRFCPAYSAPMCSPFSATERFMSGTKKTSATARTANSQKSSK